MADNSLSSSTSFLTTSINELECNICGNFLSYFPIFLTKNKNICGRCPAGDDVIRNNAYEVAVASHKFPCRFTNEGCFEDFFPIDMPDHEKECSFRIVKCPLLLDCDWKGNSAGLINHCEEKHLQSLLKENQDFNIDLMSSYEINQFLICDQNLLVVSWEFESEEKELRCLVTHHQEELEEKKYICKLALKHGRRTHSTDFDMNTISKVLYLDWLEGPSDAAKITGSISFRKSCQELDQPQKEFIQKNILSLLKCSLCAIYVLPPIYTLSNGIVTCEGCCKGKSSLPLNVTLNNLANLIEYPCKNKESGCLFRATALLMKEHQELCQFTVIKCICRNRKVNKCFWEDELKKAQSHIQEKHKFYESGTILDVDLSAKTGKVFCQLLKFESHFFQLRFGSNKDSVFWIVEKVRGVSGKFKYEIILIDSDGGDRLIVRKSCSNFEKIFGFENLMKCDFTCCILRNQISSFTKNEGNNVYFSFEVRIYNDF